MKQACCQCGHEKRDHRRAVTAQSGPQYDECKVCLCATYQQAASKQDVISEREISGLRSIGRESMPWNGSAAMPFTLSSVHLYAPKMSGVYAIFADNAWFYVGEADNISAALMNHLRGKKTWEAELDPKYFAFELLTGAARGARKETLNLAYTPAYTWRETAWIRAQAGSPQP